MTQIWIVYPDTGGVSLVSEDAQRDVWGPRGWLPVEVDYAAASAAAGVPITRPAQLTEEYVRARAAEQAAAASPSEPDPADTTITISRRAGRNKAHEEPAA